MPRHKFSKRYYGKSQMCKTKENTVIVIHIWYIFDIKILLKSFLYFLNKFKSKFRFFSSFPNSHYLGHLKLNRHFLKSIFDLPTLNQFPNGFLHCTRGWPKKIHDIFPAPYRPPNPLFHFLVSPFLFFVYNILFVKHFFWYVYHSWLVYKKL